MRGSRGGGWGGQGILTPLENYKNIGFLSNTGPDPLKITKLQSQHSMLGHQRPASETPFKWPTKSRARSGSKLFVTFMEFLKSADNTVRYSITVFCHDVILYTRAISALKFEAFEV